MPAADQSPTLASTHPVDCCGVFDTYSHRVVSWSIDTSFTGAFVTNALGMAIDSRLDARTEPGKIIYSDRAVQFGLLSLTSRAKDSRLQLHGKHRRLLRQLPRSTRSGVRMQVELLDREKRDT